MTQTVDYTGNWLNTSQENMENLMKNLGMAWAKRKMFATLNFGVGRAKMIIKQNGDEFDIDVTGPKSFNNKFTVGAGEQIIEGADGKVPCTPEWGENGELIMHTKMMGKDIVITRRLLDPNTMEMEMDDGTVIAKRIFTRQ